MDTRLSILAKVAVNGAVELPRSERIYRIKTGKQPTAVEHLALRTRHSPPHAQPLQQDWRDHGVTVLAALALFHA
jgi:hypothetical protein